MVKKLAEMRPRSWKYVFVPRQPVACGRLCVMLHVYQVTAGSRVLRTTLLIFRGFLRPWTILSTLAYTQTSAYVKDEMPVGNK